MQSQKQDCKKNCVKKKQQLTFFAAVVEECDEDTLDSVSKNKNKYKNFTDISAHPLHTFAYKTAEQYQHDDPTGMV